MIKVIFKRNVTRIATAFALVAMTALSSCEHKDLCSTTTLILLSTSSV